MADAPQPPHDDTVHEAHGCRLPDPYAWLRTPNWQEALKDPAKLDESIRAYLETENAYTEQMLAPVAGLREHLTSELRGRIKERDATVPVPDGPYAYYLRYAEDQQHPLYCRCPSDGDTSKEDVLLDGNAAAEGQDFFKVGATAHSPDHSRFAYSVDLAGSEYHRLRVRDLADGTENDLGIANAQGDLVWSNDGRKLVYTALDDHHRPNRVYRVGIDGAPELIYEEPDAAMYLGVGKTESRRFIVIAGADHSDTAEVRLLDADAPDGEPILVRARESGLDYDVAEHDGRLVLLTNHGGAIDYKIVAAPLESASDPGTWTEIVPHRPGVLIKDMVVRKHHLIRLELADARPRLVVRDFATGAERDLLPPAADDAYALGMRAGYVFDSAVLRVTYSSPRQPEHTYDADVATGQFTLCKEQDVPSGHDPDAYVVQRISVPSHDGAEVPVTLLFRRDAPPEVGRPMLLYGYGSYGLALPASFSPHRFSLIDRGMVYAMAHVRGGTDKGYRWYLDGKLAKKTNTFLDFIAAAEQLVADGAVGRGEIIANGRSAGGMLMGAIANMRPDLFRAVVAEVPFVDVWNTMRDPDLPLTPPEWSEWGNPIEDPDACRRMAGYSPYDNVRRQPYPAILATGGIADPRVTYWEPAKWVARLRANTTSGQPVVLHMNMGAGHAGKSGRFARLEELALVHAFVLQQAGLGEVELRAGR
jgi:oligopeptidase B